MSEPALTLEACLVSTATEDGSSKLGEWQRCSRGYHLRYHLGVAPKRKALALGVGSLCHACIRWHLAKPEGDPRNWTYVIAAAERAAKASEASAWDEPKPTDEAYRLMSAYFGKWGDDCGWGAAGAEIMGVELLLGDTSLHVTCRADLIVNIAGTVHVVDTKTRASSVPGKPGDIARKEWIRGQSTNEEFLRISHCVQQRFQLEAPPPVIVDAIIKTKVPQFERVVVPIYPEEIAQWAANQRLVAGDIANASGALAGGARLAPHEGRMVYGACAPYMGPKCWAFDWCHGSAEKKERCYTLGAGATPTPKESPST